jgi:hypothetical protein
MTVSVSMNADYGKICQPASAHIGTGKYNVVLALLCWPELEAAVSVLLPTKCCHLTFHFMFTIP